MCHAFLRGDRRDNLRQYPRTERCADEEDASGRG
jgi:hypothetical protein